MFKSLKRSLVTDNEEDETNDDFGDIDGDANAGDEHEQENNDDDDAQTGRDDSVAKSLAQSFKELASSLKTQSRRRVSGADDEELTRRLLNQRREVDIYDGRIPFKWWWCRLMHLKKSYRWSESATLEHAIARLGTGAIMTYQALGLDDPNTTLEEFRSKMQAVCKQGMLDQTISARIRHAQIADGQRVQEFSAYLTTLFNTMEVRPSEEFMLSALLEGVRHRFEPSSLQMARLTGSFSQATRQLIEIEAFRPFEDLPILNPYLDTPQAPLMQTMHLQQPAQLNQPIQLQQQVQTLPRRKFQRKVNQPNKNTQAQGSRDKSMYCDKHERMTNHTTEQCKLIMCDYHGWSVHGTSTCRILQGQAQPKGNNLYTGANRGAPGQTLGLNKTAPTQMAEQEQAAQQRQPKKPFWSVKRLQRKPGQLGNNNQRFKWNKSQHQVNQAQYQAPINNQSETEDQLESENYQPTQNWDILRMATTRLKARRQFYFQNQLCIAQLR